MKNLKLVKELQGFIPKIGFVCLIFFPELIVWYFYLSKMDQTFFPMGIHLLLWYDQHWLSHNATIFLVRMEGDSEFLDWISQKLFDDDRYNEECTPDSIIKFGYDVNIKLIQKRGICSKVCRLSCCNSNCEVIALILEPSYDVLSPLNQRFDLMLKSLWESVKKGLFAVTASVFNSRLLVNDSKSSCDWFGERYKETIQHSLSPIIISKLMESCKFWLPRSFKGREFL